MQNFSQIGEVPWPRPFDITRILQTMTFKFYDELSECIWSDPKVTPMLTLESDNGTGSEDIGSTEHSDSEESSSSAHGKGKRSTKKGNPIHQQQRCCPSCKSTVPNERKLKKRK